MSIKNLNDRFRNIEFINKILSWLNQQEKKCKNTIPLWVKFSNAKILGKKKLYKKLKFQFLPAFSQLENETLIFTKMKVPSSTPTSA